MRHLSFRSTSNNPFRYINGDLYVLADRVSMEAAWNRLSADLYMCVLRKKVFQENLSLKQTQCTRYVDIIFEAVEGDKCLNCETKR